MVSSNDAVSDAAQSVPLIESRTLGLVSRRARKKRATKQAIYKVAVRLFMKQGYRETTIGDITDAADVSRSTFFNYYASKAEILHEIAAEALDFARCTFDRNFAQPGESIGEKIRGSLRCFAMIVERDTRYYQTVFLDAMRSQAGFIAANQEAASRLINGLTQHLHNAQRAGELNPSLDASQLAEMLTGIYMYAILSYILKGCPGSLVEQIDKAGEIFLQGCQAH